MAKYKFYVSTKYVRSAVEEIIEIDDEELEDLTEEEISDLVQEYYNDWLINNCEMSFWKVDEE